MFKIICLLKIKMKLIILNLKILKKIMGEACNNIRPLEEFMVQLMMETRPVWLTQ